MFPWDMADKLYLEVVVISTIISLILVYNNYSFYKMKVSSYMSRVQFNLVAICVMDLFWALLFKGPINYIFACGYVIATVASSSAFFMFVLEALGYRPNKMKGVMLFYYGSNVIVALLTLTTPFTHWVYKIGSDGYIDYMFLGPMDLYLQIFFFLLSFIVANITLLHSIGMKTQIHDRARIIIDGVWILSLCKLLTVLILGTVGDYAATEFSLAVALTYIFTRMNVTYLLDVKEKEVATQSDLNSAATIQFGALRKEFPPFANHPEIDLYATMLPAKEVGGDFFDCFELDEDKVCFLVADVSGKGIPAAMFMMTAKTMIWDFSLVYKDTEQIFTKVNELLCENNTAEMFVTAWIGILDTKTLMLQYTNAGHTKTAYAKAGEPFGLLKKVHGMVLAGYEDTRYSSNRLQMQPGDRLFLYSDGVTEAHNEELELFGKERMLAVLDESDMEGGRMMLAEMQICLGDFMGTKEQFDDITMMVVTIKEK